MTRAPFAGAIEAAGSWDGEVASSALRPEPLSKSTPNPFPIAQATRSFLDEVQETAAFATHKKYRLLTARLNRFSGDRGYAMIDRWEPLDVHQFRSTWLVAP
jgi:hypothetical protein